MNSFPCKPYANRLSFDADSMRVELTKIKIEIKTCVWAM